MIYTNISWYTCSCVLKNRTKLITKHRKPKHNKFHCTRKKICCKFPNFIRVYDTCNNQWCRNPKMCRLNLYMSYKSCCLFTIRDLQYPFWMDFWGRVFGFFFSRFRSTGVGSSCGTVIVYSGTWCSSQSPSHGPEPLPLPSYDWERKYN